MSLRESKTNIQKQETKDEPQTSGSYNIREILIKIMEYTQKQSQKSPTKTKCNRLTQQTKETKNDIHQLRTKLTKAQTEKQYQSKVPTGE